MWIRSQDRTKLVDASELNICSSYKVVGIYAGFNALGMYSTEEKAMKVMDMIQKQIAFCSERYEIVRPVLRSDPFEPYWKKREAVFQLPKDDEVEV